MERIQNKTSFPANCNDFVRYFKNYLSFWPISIMIFGRIEWIYFSLHLKFCIIGACTIKTFMVVFLLYCNKLDCFPLFTSTPGYCLQGRLEATRVEPFVGLLSNGRLLALPTKSGLGWKWMAVANTTAYYDLAIITALKCFYSTWSWGRN
jgi:hypothetical protein